MDLAKVLQELHEELEYLDAAILSLERLQETGRRRGRPPNILADLKSAARSRPKRKEEPGAAEAGRRE